MASEQEFSSEEGGGGVTWETSVMEVKGHLISAPDPLTCPDRKQRERIAELQVRRRSLQSLLNMRLAELRHICLQEAELTGVMPRDFPLEVGEKLPCVRRRAGVSRQGNRQCRAEVGNSQRSKPKKTLFSGGLRKHSDSEHNTHTQTHTHHGKWTVHRGCHTDDTVRSESSSTSDSTGHDNGKTHTMLFCLLKTFVFFSLSSSHLSSSSCRCNPSETLQTHKALPLPPPPHSQDSSSSSSGPSDPGPAGEGVVRVSTACCSNGSNNLLEHITPPGEDAGPQVMNAAETFRSSETLMDRRTRINNGPSKAGGRGGGAGQGRRGGGYSEVLLDYVWGKQQQQQLQRQKSQPTNRQPITSQHLLYNGYSSQQPPGAPPTYRSHHDNQCRVKVTRTKSCGPFLPVQQNQSDTHNPPLSAIQPDPHPHLLPPRPPQLPPSTDAQLEEATRSLHKALALEGLRDWYLRNTIGSTHQNHEGGALQRRRTTHGVIQQSAYQTETSHHHAPLRQKQTLPHSATFHGHPLHGRSVDSSLYHDSFPPQKQEIPLRDLTMDQPSPGTLV
uniref:Coiled-coil domain containing 120a n=1 Tax=Mastacembelus armatus TaxID=205130 RepID=A0A3Q3M816_9TELE